MATLPETEKSADIVTTMQSSGMGYIVSLRVVDVSEYQDQILAENIEKSMQRSADIRPRSVA